MHRFYIGEKVFNIKDVGVSEMAYKVGTIVSITRNIYDNKYIYEIEYGNDVVKTMPEHLIIKYIEDDRYDNYISIKFQKGSARLNGVNGCQVEDVIDVLIEELTNDSNSDDSNDGGSNSETIRLLKKAKYSIKRSKWQG